jgi:hypothetical protein
MKGDPCEFMFRIDIGYRFNDGYIAVCQDVKNNQTNMGKAHGIRELMRHVAQVICNQEQHNRRFPMESGPCIVIPNKAEQDVFGFKQPDNGEVTE